MKPEEMRIAIAEWCGELKRPEGQTVLFRRFDPPNAVYELVRFPDGSERPCYQLISDYLNDLNCMHVAEMKLPDAGSCMRYVFNLQSVCGAKYFGQNYFATAAQRAEALLRTISK